VIAEASELGRPVTRASRGSQILLRIAGLAMFWASQPASAHHSYAMFDRSNAQIIAGTVARFDWSNPHVFLWIYAAAKASSTSQKVTYELFGFEGGSPGTLTRGGWTKSTFEVGEKISVYYYPLKDGRNGGSFFKVVHSDGSISEAGGPKETNDPRPDSTVTMERTSIPSKSR